MRVGVIADQMTPRGDLANQLRASARKAPDQKEGRARVVLFEQIEQPRCDGWIGAVVKRKRERVASAGAAHGGTEQLCPGGHGAPGGYTRCRRGDSWHCNRPGVHENKPGMRKDASMVRSRIILARRPERRYRRGQRARVGLLPPFKLQDSPD